MFTQVTRFSLIKLPSVWDLLKQKGKCKHEFKRHAKAHLVKMPLPEALAVSVQHLCGSMMDRNGLEKMVANVR